MGRSTKNGSFPPCSKGCNKAVTQNPVKKAANNYCRTASSTLQTVILKSPRFLAPPFHYTHTGGCDSIWFLAVIQRQLLSRASASFSAQGGGLCYAPWKDHIVLGHHCYWLMGSKLKAWGGEKGLGEGERGGQGRKDYLLSLLRLLNAAQGRSSPRTFCMPIFTRRSPMACLPPLRFHWGSKTHFVNTQSQQLQLKPVRSLVHTYVATPEYKAYCGQKSKHTSTWDDMATSGLFSQSLCQAAATKGGRTVCSGHSNHRAVHPSP